jgi:hypothetical protein
VGLRTVPAAAATVKQPRPLSPFQRDESLEVTGPHIKSGDAPLALCLVRGFPTARLPERGLRENLDDEPKCVAVTAICGGGRPATDKRHPGYTVLQSAPSYAAALRGEDAESGILPNWS